MAVSIPLREFLYLDTKLTDEFLAQIEGGVYSEEAQRRLEQQGKDVGGEAGLSGFGGRAAVRGGRKSSGEEETERTVQQTPESALSRLIQLLNDQQAAQWLEAVDDAIWDQLQRGEIIEAECNVSVSTIKRFSSLAQEVGYLMSMLEEVGEGGLDAESRQAMEMLTAMGGLLGNSVPIVAALAGSPDYKLIAALEPAYLRVEVDQLDGEATVLAKIHKKLAPDERHTMIDLIPGFRGLPPAQRREMEEGLENTPDLPRHGHQPAGCTRHGRRDLPLTSRPSGRDRRPS